MYVLAVLVSCWSYEYYFVLALFVLFSVCFVFFKQKTAYEMRISDWSSDVCSSDLARQLRGDQNNAQLTRIYGTGWLNKKQLDAHLTRLEEAAKIGRASCRERVCQYV